MSRSSLMCRRGDDNRTPDAAKLRKGETRPARLNGLEPLPRHRLPSMPKGLDPVARAAWRHTVREMGSSGVITAADAHVLRMYCESWSRYRKAADMLADFPPLLNDRGHLTKNPLHQVVRDDSELLSKVGDLDDQAMTEIVRLYSEGLAKPDELTLARIEREREDASQRLARTRDIAAWQATMARLDAEQQVARQPRQQQRMAPDEVVAYLRSLPKLWADSGPEGRQALAAALFTKLEVEGYTKMRYELTPDAVDLGLGAALPAQLETGGHTGGFGRGERGSASLAHLRFRPRFVLENVTPGARAWPTAYRKAG